MNFLETIESIKEKLVSNNREDIADEILELQLSGGTGGEVLILVCSRLLRIKKDDKPVYKLIDNESESLIKYANSIKLYPIASPRRNVQSKKKSNGGTLS